MHLLLAYEIKVLFPYTQLKEAYRYCSSAVNFYGAFYAPNFEKVGDILVSACPYVRTYVFMFEISS